MKGIRSIPPSFLIRILIMALLIVTALAAANFSPLADFFDEEQQSRWIEVIRQARWSPLGLIGLYLLTAFGVPAGPLLVLGALFGTFYGFLYNIIGLLLAAALCFAMAKWLGRDFVVHITGNRLDRVGRFMRRFGFWPLVQTRFLPFPAFVVNFSAALAGVPMRLFFFTTFMGLIPSTLIHTYFIAELIVKQGRQQIIAGVLYLGVFVAFNIIIGWPWIMKQLRRRKRYRQLCQQRAARELRCNPILSDNNN